MCTGAEIMIAASVAQGVGGMMSSSSEAKQYKTRAGQVLKSGMQEIDQAAYEQERYRGSQRAAIGKAGIKMSGTAKTLTDEQLMQDEKTLLTMKYNTMLGVKDNTNAYKAKKMEGFNALMGGLAQGAGQYQSLPKSNKMLGSSSKASGWGYSSGKMGGTDLGTSMPWRY